MSAEEFSEEEFRAIRSLRERLSDLAVDGSVAGAYLAEDSTVWRYVLAKSQDEDSEAESEAMFRRSIRWREVSFRGARLLVQFINRYPCRTCSLPRSARNGAKLRKNLYRLAIIQVGARRALGWANPAFTEGS